MGGSGWPVSFITLIGEPLRGREGPKRELWKKRTDRRTLRVRSAILHVYGLRTSTVHLRCQLCDEVVMVVTRAQPEPLDGLGG